MPALPFEIINADCRQAMADMAPESIDAVVCDPPYGLSFMGKGWDHGVPGVEFWREALRVLKPGGHLLAFGGTRTFHRLTVAIEDAGFEIRDCLSWMYGSGFPKSMDVSKAIDKAAGKEREVVGQSTQKRDLSRNGRTGDEAIRPVYAPNVTLDITAPATPEAEQWQGWGTALKPAWEPIVVARKPLIGTVAANVLEHGTGGLNIDETRIDAGGDKLGGGAESKTTKDQKGNEGWTRPWMEDPDAQEAHAARVRANVEKAEAKGRWPANVVLTHHEDCVETGVRKVKSDGHFPKTRPGSTEITTTGHGGQDDLEERYTAGETVPAFDCHLDCPVRLLDEQTGTLTSGKATIGAGKGRADNATSIASTGKVASCFADKGGASRFFYNAKVSKKERNLGLPDGMKNDHPTCKPVAVMAWLCRLVTPAGGTVLDPFMGGGSTGVAALNEGFRFVGVDNEADYCEIARHRLGHAAGAEVI